MPSITPAKKRRRTYIKRGRNKPLLQPLFIGMKPSRSKKERRKLRR